MYSCNIDKWYKAFSHMKTSLYTRRCSNYDAASSQIVQLYPCFFICYLSATIWFFWPSFRSKYVSKNRLFNKSWIWLFNTTSVLYSSFKMKSMYTYAVGNIFFHCWGSLSKSIWEGNVHNIFSTSILNKVFSDCCEQSTLDANATKGLHTYVYCTYIHYTYSNVILYNVYKQSWQ